MTELSQTDPTPIPAALADCDGIALYRTIVEGVVGRGDLALAQQLFADDFDATRVGLQTMFGLFGPPGPGPAGGPVPSGKQRFMGGLGRIRASFPDWACTIHHVVAEGDVVGGSFTVRGSFTGPEPFMGFAPTGRSFTMAEAGFLTIRDGQATSGWFVGDELALLQAISDDVPTRP